MMESDEGVEEAWGDAALRPEPRQKLEKNWYLVLPTPPSLAARNLDLGRRGVQDFFCHDLGPNPAAPRFGGGKCTIDDGGGSMRSLKA